MDNAKKFYSYCSFGLFKVGETPIVAGTVEARISAKGVQFGEFSGKKYAKFVLSIQNQTKNIVYWASRLGADEKDFLIKAVDNGSEYITLSIYVAERDVEYAEKNLKPGDTVSVTGFLRFTTKDEKRYVSLNAHSGGIKIVRKADATKPTPAKEVPSTDSPEAKYTPEQPDIEEEDLPF